MYGLGGTVERLALAAVKLISVAVSAGQFDAKRFFFFLVYYNFYYCENFGVNIGKGLACLAV